MPLYISDCRRLYEMTDWRPERSPQEILADIHEWVRINERTISAALEA